MNPLALRGGADHYLTDRGLTHYNNWIKLYRNVDPLEGVQSDLRVEKVGFGYGDVFAKIVMECFGWPEMSPAWIGSLFGRENWHHYMAFDGDTPVATGSFYVYRVNAWIDFAATLESHRGRGAQSALLQRRVKDIAKLGCTQIVVETAEDKPEKPAPSFRNMVRFGFQTAYVCPNYIFVK